MILAIVLASALLSGCASITASSVDAETHATNYFHSTFFLTKNATERIDVASRTKTTSKLIGAKNIETSGDVEMVKALAEFGGSMVAAGAKGAAK